MERAEGSRGKVILRATKGSSTVTLMLTREAAEAQRERYEADGWEVEIEEPDEEGV
ncbi:MAG TPA: hypothetical protein VNO79_01300 [Actinomycetota bacterium]|nr:hypothetical protein [Actinomycetota bacterium]